jgi:hypothetical protein
MTDSARTDRLVALLWQLHADGLLPVELGRLLLCEWFEQRPAEQVRVLLERTAARGRELMAAEQN